MDYPSGLRKSEVTKHRRKSLIHQNQHRQNIPPAKILAIILLCFFFDSQSNFNSNNDIGSTHRRSKSILRSHFFVSADMDDRPSDSKSYRELSGRLIKKPSITHLKGQAQTVEKIIHKPEQKDPQLSRILKKDVASTLTDSSSTTETQLPQVLKEPTDSLQPQKKSSPQQTSLRKKANNKKTTNRKKKTHKKKATNKKKTTKTKMNKKEKVAKKKLANKKKAAKKLKKATKKKKATKYGGKKNQKKNNKKKGKFGKTGKTGNASNWWGHDSIWGGNGHYGKSGKSVKSAKSHGHIGSCKCPDGSWGTYYYEHAHATSGKSSKSWGSSEAWGAWGYSGKSGKSWGAWGSNESWGAWGECHCSTDEPTFVPTYYPTYVPTEPPTYPPSPSPTYEPTYPPSYGPTREPSVSPSAKPSLPPTDEPTQVPTQVPTQAPTFSPSAGPTLSPTPAPSLAELTDPPTSVPTYSPVVEPTPRPTKRTHSPNCQPTERPTDSPTESPTDYPTESPTEEPTVYPTTTPTLNPTISPTVAPTGAPIEPTQSPTFEPTESPTTNPTLNPTESPTQAPTGAPIMPTQSPTITPTSTPTVDPTSSPTVDPTSSPTQSPFGTYEPTSSPTIDPTFSPTLTPTLNPTTSPTESPIGLPTLNPTESPTLNPTQSPTLNPTQSPTISPTLSPTAIELNWWFWGAEEGRGDQLNNLVNQQVPDFIPEDVRDVSAGSRYTIVVDANGVASSEGFIESALAYRGHFGVDPGKLSEGANSRKIIDRVMDTKEKEVDAPPFTNAYAGATFSADAGEMHSLLIDESGNVYTMGNNNKGQLCLGDEEERYLPHQVDLPGPAISAAVGGDFTLILLDDGNVYGCGSNENGELGLGNNVATTNRPDSGNGLKDIADLKAGLSYSLFLGEDNSKLYSSGSNVYGQQCFFTQGDPQKRPREFELVDNKGDAFEVMVIEAGRESSYFLLNDGTVLACGRNDEGQLGDGTFLDTTPEEPVVQVDIPKNEVIYGIGAGASAQSAFFIGDEEVYGAGANDRFQLGIDEIGSREFPVKVDFGEDVDIDKISASGTHTVALGIIL